MILGLLAILFSYFYLASLTVSQCAWYGYTSGNPNATLYVETLFKQGKSMFAASFLAHSADLLVLPIVFQIFHNRNCRLFFSVLATLVFGQAIECFVFQLIASSELSDWWDLLRMTYLARVLIMLWLSVLATIYLKLCNLEASGSRRPLDILVAFLGGYSRAQQLQRYLREWEGRYRVVVQNSSDLIFILDQDGQVLNANEAAVRGLGHGEQTNGLFLPGIMTEAGETAANWEPIWQALNPLETSAAPPVHREWEALTASGARMYLDVNVSRAELQEKPVAVVIARDVTERRRLEQEREKLQDQLLHSQRMQAVGQLAGGVAHDFNNLLHTIQGSLDGLAKASATPDVQKGLLRNIGEATNRASTPTAQLLGFARKGKFRSEKLNVATTMEKSWALFEPVAHRDIRPKLIVAPTPMYITGDSTQLQQVFLNILLNARDAILERGGAGKIVFRAEPAASYTPGWQMRPKPEARPEDYVCIRIKDDGTGIPEEIKPRIFDPFFTTKEVGKGTGMGLAMAYGCVANCNGWIHVESEVGKGTEFFIFMPSAG